MAVGRCKGFVEITDVVLIFGLVPSKPVPLRTTLRFSHGEWMRHPPQEGGVKQAKSRPTVEELGASKKVLNGIGIISGWRDAAILGRVYSYKLCVEDEISAAYGVNPSSQIEEQFKYGSRNSCKTY